MGKAPYVIFSSFFSIILSHLHKKAEKLTAGSHSISFCDRGQFSLSKYFDFTKQYVSQNYRMKNTTKPLYSSAQGFSNQA